MSGFNFEITISALTVFLQGILSFFSPCVLPLVPLYIGYLSGGAKTVDDDGVIHYRQGKVMLNTLFFVVGVSFAFFLLGFGFTAAGQFLSHHHQLIAKIGGVLIILFGLYQLGIFGASRFLSMERRLPLHLERMTMSPITALVLGFTFSFAWTPCVGPALTSVLLMAGSSSSAGMGFLLIGVYTLGFVIPFLGVGLFTSTLLDLFRKHQKVVRYTVKIGGVLMIFMGIMMLTGWINTLSASLSSLGNGSQGTTSSSDTVGDNSQNATGDVSGGTDSTPDDSSAGENSSEEEPTTENLPAAPDFLLNDQFGNPHTLADYKGKTIFLNFWATWCGPCLAEMPEIQELYEDWDKNQSDLVVLGVANPVSEEYPYNQDVSQEEITSFLSDNGYTYPVLMDTTGSLFAQYGVYQFPTTFMITAEGEVFGYVSGSLNREFMDSMVEQTMTGKRVQPAENSETQ